MTQQQVRERFPSISLALDVRSYETVMVLAELASTYRYDERWVRPTDFDRVTIDELTVVVVDRVMLSRQMVASLLSAGPRAVAFVMPPKDFDFEKEVRRSLRALYPFGEVWEVSTDMGKCLMTTTFGRPYDRSSVIDRRPQGVRA